MVFLVSIWLFVLYWAVLGKQLEVMRKPSTSWFIDIETRILTWPFYFSLAHLIIAMPNFILSPRQPALLLKLYGLIYLYKKCYTPDVLSQKGLTEVSLMVGILGVAWIPMRGVVWL